MGGRERGAVRALAVRRPHSRRRRRRASDRLRPRRLPALPRRPPGGRCRSEEGGGQPPGSDRPGQTIQPNACLKPLSVRREPNPLRLLDQRLPDLSCRPAVDAGHATRSRRVPHPPGALRERLSHDFEAADKWLRGHPITDPDRAYQQAAVGAIEAGLRNGKRQMMVAMATGSGKTRMAIASIYRLMKAGFAQRVLFLVDRRALAAQAVGALAAYEPEPGLKFDRIYETYSQRFQREDFEEEGGRPFDPKVMPQEYLTDPDGRHAFVYVSTIQRMRINLFGPPTDSVDEEFRIDAEEIDIPIHAFDLIIADECHRGYTATEESKWREVLKHFDATTIGLTATPAQHTTAYFGPPIY